MGTETKWTKALKTRFLDLRKGCVTVGLGQFCPEAIRLLAFRPPADCVYSAGGLVEGRTHVIGRWVTWVRPWPLVLVGSRSFLS